MRLSKLTTMMAIALMVSFASLAQADELGGNLGFEDDMGPTNGTPSTANPNWFGFDNGAGTLVEQITGATARSGNRHAQISITSTPNTFVGIQQWIDAVEGENYTFSFFARNDGGTFDVGNEFRIEFMNSSGGEISRSQLTTAFTNTYTQYTVGGVSPTGTTQVRAVIALQSFQGGTDGTALIDDTSIQGPAIVPEPGSLIVLGMGAVGMMIRRRRV